MKEPTLTKNTIEYVNRELVALTQNELQKDLEQILLFGSYARGDYNDDSDIDIALLMNCNRKESKKYDDAVDEIATTLALKYKAIVNFILIPMDEYIEKRDWYAFYRNISDEGRVLYG